MLRALACKLIGHGQWTLLRSDCNGYDVFQCPRCLTVKQNQRPPMSPDDFFARFVKQEEVLCAFNGHDEAAGIFYAPEGCICKEETIQPLCAQHALKAQQNGVDLRLICRLDGGPSSC